MNSTPSLRRLLSVAASLAALLPAMAEQPDSIPMPSGNGNEPSFMIPGGITDPTSVDLSKPLLLPTYGIDPSLSLKSAPAMPSFSTAGLASPDIATWHGGSLSASSSFNSLPGMMGIESGMISLNQTIGSLSLSLWGGATHYGYFRGMQRSWDFGGSLNYRFNDRWSITLFGEYHSPLHPMTPGMAGYMGVPRFGGYASYEINDHWGISVGAQAQRSLVTNQWEAQPIVTPYYKFNDDVKIGIDVGGIIYNIAKDWIESSHGRPVGSPVIAPPRPGPPPVAPRR